MPESWAVFSSSSSWANKSSDLPLCIISSACLGALPWLGAREELPRSSLSRDGASTAALGSIHHRHLGQSVSSDPLTWARAVSIPQNHSPG